MDRSVDVEGLVTQLIAGGDPADRQALLDALLSGEVSSIFEKLDTTAEPMLLPVPSEISGFRLRLDLLGAEPPVWRRLEVPGDLTLPRVHDLIQTAMGWTDSHLHRFRTGADHRSPYFVTTFDLDEGDDRVLEDDVRLDQLLSREGDELWYEYDFGDDWEHTLKVEAVLDEPPTTARCLGGRMACPPEDCGGIGGHDELARWVRSGYDDTLLPEGFEDAAHAHNWLPVDWHPDRFDLDEVNGALAVSLAEPVPVTGELAELNEQLDHRGIRRLREVLGRPLSHASADVTEGEAARLSETYRIFLEVVGDGVALTAAGYLPPNVVEQFAERSGMAGWWIGKANREDLTPPVAGVRDRVRALGLVRVRQGRLTPTAAGIRCRQDAQALWQHVVGRLPLGTKDFDRNAGWMALTVAGSGVPTEVWGEEVSDLLYALGWRTDRRDAHPSAYSPTIGVLNDLAGAARIGRQVTGLDPAVAATARAVIRRG